MTKLAIITSHFFSFYDLPKGRKIHKEPIPILGGFALFATIGISILLFSSFESSSFLVGLIGAFFIFLIGLYDDKYALKPWLKICLQAIVISFAFFNGIRIEFITWPAYMQPIFFSPIISFIITQIWMIIIINMFNIIDGIDGLAVGISCLTSIVLFFVSLSVSPIFISYLICTIIGSTGMFLKFNFYPAKMGIGSLCIFRPLGRS